MKIRCRGSEGQKTIEIEQTAKLGELKLLLGGNILISTGFPPKKVDKMDSETLESCGIRHGDVIVYENITINATLNDQVKVFKENDQVVKDDSCERITLEDGELVVRIMKDDNSCLFRSIGYIFLLDASVDTVKRLRQSIEILIFSGIRCNY